MYKTETVEEFLARGGKITKIDNTQAQKQASVAVKVKNTGHDSIISSDDADLYYGDPSHKKVSKRKRKENKIDFNALPKELQASLLEQINVDLEDENDE